jgi:lysophospholipase L1-like esterase
MQKNRATAHISISNQAAGGNRILTDGKGPNALGRVDRDVLAHTGVKYAMIYEGINDINKLELATAEAQTALGDRLIAAFRQIVPRLHAAGIPVFAATITPFSAPTNASSGSCTAEPNPCPVREATRQRLNAFIRTGGLFDAVIDFDRVVADSAVASQMSPIFNSGDFLHPNVAGYTAMAEAFPLDLFERFSGGVSRYT